MKIFIFMLNIFVKSPWSFFGGVFGGFVVLFFSFLSLKVNHYSVFRKGEKERY